MHCMANCTFLCAFCVSEDKRKHHKKTSQCVMLMATFLGSRVQPHCNASVHNCWSFLICLCASCAFLNIFPRVCTWLCLFVCIYAFLCSWGAFGRSWDPVRELLGILGALLGLSWEGCWGSWALLDAFGTVLAPV